MSEKKKRGIFKIKGTDRRQQYIESFANDVPFVTQVPSGPNVEHFHPDWGFLLLIERKMMSYNNARARRIDAIAQLSMGPKLALREFYYALRGKPELVKAFSGTKNIYEAVLQGMMHVEITCDIDRHEFTVGNFPKGTIYYGHSHSYGDIKRLVGFTEDLVRDVVSPWEIENAMMIVHLEKNTAAGRLQSMGFSKLCNAVITTAGGNFTRAVYVWVGRFINLKPMIFFCDGDPFGNDMLRTLEYGSMNSRHVTLDQAFPEKKNPNMYIAGLFPSVGERIGLPNDVQSKRPMSNKTVADRIDFLRSYELANEKDLATWGRNKTYELEAMSIFYENDVGEPVGLAAYLIEGFRINKIPLKPEPTDEDIGNMRRLLKRSVESKIRERVAASSPVLELKDAIDEYFDALIESRVRVIYEENEEMVDKALEDTDDDDIKDNLNQQYRDNPYREKFNYFELIQEMMEKVSVDIDWDKETLIKTLTDGLDKYAEEADIEVESEIIVNPVEALEHELENMYDVVERQLGIRPRDAKEMEEALRWRLEIEEH